MDAAGALDRVGLEPIESIAESFARDNEGAAALGVAAAWVADADAVLRCLGWEVYRHVVLNRADLIPDLLGAAPKGLGDADPDVRRRAVHALGNQADPRIVDLALPALGDPDEDVRIQALNALASGLQEAAADHPAIDALLASLDDPVPAVRDWAAFVVGSQLDVDRPDLRDKLVALLDEDEAISNAAAEAAVGLARRADARAVPTILRYLAEPDPGKLWFEAADALGIATPE